MQAYTEKSKGNDNIQKLCRAAGTNFFKLSAWEGFGGRKEKEDLICPAFAMGICKFDKCTLAHMYGSELPKGYTGHLVKAVEKATKNINAESDGGPNKRQKQGDGDDI